MIIRAAPPMKRKVRPLPKNVLINTYSAALQMTGIDDHFNGNNAGMAIHASTNVAIGTHLEKLGIEVTIFTSAF